MNVLSLILVLSILGLIGLWADKTYNNSRVAVVVGLCYYQLCAWAIQAYSWTTQAYSWVRGSICWKMAYGIFHYTTVCGVVFFAVQVRKAWNNDKDVSGMFWLGALVLYTAAAAAVWLYVAYMVLRAVYQILTYRIW